MPLTQEHTEFIAGAVASAIDEVYLVDEEGNTVSGPKSATFVKNGSRAELESDVTFDIEAENTVAGWRAKNSDTDFGGYDFESSQFYEYDGKAVLTAEYVYFEYEKNE